MENSNNQTMKLAPCKYKTGNTLGCGSYALVKEAVEIQTGNIYAAKILSKKVLKGRENLVRNEIFVLKEISNNHPNVLTLVDYFETTNSLYLITELATGGELFDRIYNKGSYYESDASLLIYTILDAVNYLHSKGVVHRDLKPENLLFKTAAEDSPLLIADFGFARIVEDEQYELKTMCGTPEYMAPEVFLNKKYGKPVDMWAIGVITYFVLCGHCPFSYDKRTRVVESILNVDYTFSPKTTWESISPDSKDFIRKLLIFEPENRLTIEEALKHKWTKTHLDEHKYRKNNLLPKIRDNFDATKTFKKAFDVIKAINIMKKKDILPNEEDTKTEHVMNFG